MTDDPSLPPPKHGLPVPAKPAAALEVPADIGRPHADDVALIERLRREVRTLDFEPLTDAQVATSAVALPSADASNAVEGNPFTAADWQFRRMLLEERVPARASLGPIRRFGTECRLDDADGEEAARG